jgi:pyruvate/2-oxoglutarate dehydrogenase complex dihydrolipoamide acyltransferase (E2) component
MPTTEEATPLDPVPIAVAPAGDEPAATPPEPPADVARPEGEAPPSPSDTLSPAVRRLVRQFDLDITAIHGTGPDGRIRVGDVMDLLGGRKDSGNRDAPVARTLRADSASDPPDDEVATGAAPAAGASSPALGASGLLVPTSTVFDCDLSRVLSHRKRQRRDDVELLLTSYFLAAFATALETFPELGAAGETRFGVLLMGAEGQSRSLLVEPAAGLAAAPLPTRLLTIDETLRASIDGDLASASLLVHHYGESGSLLATPTPIGAGHAASLGIGRVRREIVVRTIEGVETPRVAARCYIGLSFLADRVPFEGANRFLAHAIRILEQWPE